MARPSDNHRPYIQNKDTIVDLKIGTLLYRLNESIRTTVPFQIIVWSPTLPGCIYQPKTNHFSLVLPDSDWSWSWPLHRLPFQHKTDHMLYPGSLNSAWVLASLLSLIRIQFWSWNLPQKYKLRPAILWSHKQVCLPTLIIGWHQM